MIGQIRRNLVTVAQGLLKDKVNQGYIKKETKKHNEYDVSQTLPYTNSLENQSLKCHLKLAHRGKWHGVCVENTLQSFDETVSHLSDSLHGFECDLRQEVGGNPRKWVIFHDDNQLRFNGNNNIDVAVPIEYRGKTGQIPTLDNFCDWLKKVTRPIVINIEIKSGDNDGISYLIKKLNDSNPNNSIRFIFSSFDNTIINQLAQDSSIEFGILFNELKDLKKVKENGEINTCRFIATSFDTYRLHKAQIEMLGCSLGVYFKSKNEFEKHKNSIENDLLVSLIFVEV